MVASFTPACLLTLFNASCPIRHNASSTTRGKSRTPVTCSLTFNPKLSPYCFKAGNKPFSNPAGRAPD